MSSPLLQWFLEYDQARPEVWEAFKRYTLQAVSAGRRMGAKAVAERVRWEMAVEKGDDGFRLNNNAVAFYARRFMAQFPQHGEVFRLRERRETQEEAA